MKSSRLPSLALILVMSVAALTAIAQVSAADAPSCGSSDVVASAIRS